MKIRFVILAAAALTIAGAACSVEPTSDPAATNADDGHLTDREAIGGWFTANGHIMSDFGDASGTISDAASDRDVAGMVAGCRQMARVAAAGQAAQPIPVATVDVHWQEALTNYALAATACIDGGTNSDAGTLEVAVDYMTAATAAVNAATEAVDLL